MCICCVCVACCCIFVAFVFDAPVRYEKACRILALEVGDCYAMMAINRCGGVGVVRVNVGVWGDLGVGVGVGSGVGAGVGVAKCVCG